MVNSYKRVNQIKMKMIKAQIQRNIKDEMKNNYYSKKYLLSTNWTFYKNLSDLSLSIINYK